MKTNSFLTLALAALTAGGYMVPEALADTPTRPAKAAKRTRALASAAATATATAAAADDAKQVKSQPNSYNGNTVQAKEWANCKALEKRLSADILSKLKGTDAAAVQAFIAAPANRLMLAQWFVARRENAVDASKLAAPKEGETIPARTFAELLASGDAETVSIVKLLTNNLEWMEKVAYSGECVRPGRMMSIIVGLCQDKKLDMQRKFLTNRVLLEVATATALEWARWDWSYNGALERARFYMLNHKAKRFHKGFKSLPFWHYRIICGSKGNNANGSLASLEWALDNVHLPIEQYPGACWYANYLSDNLFGDSIHGPYYYSPYDDYYGSNALKRSRDIGGVCGSLSHFGAFCAVANGVPAMPAGEPGHCAYIVNVNGKWVPSYSLSWERGLHWQAWNGTDKYSSLHMASELYAPEQAVKTSLSNACRTLGDICAAAGQADKALDLYRESVKAQPCNYLAWHAYADLLRDSKAGDAAAWKQLYKDMSKRLAPLYAEMAAQLLQGRVHGPLFKVCPSAADRMECFTVFWKAVKGMGPDRWAVEQFCDAQAGALKDDKRGDIEAKLALYTMVLSHTADKAPYAPVILAWGNGASARADEATQRKFFKATLTGLSKGKGMEEGARDKILNQAMLGAEKMRDRSSFQTIGKMLAQKYRKPRLPQWDAFPGKLVSENGMIYTSSTCQHDWPCEHWGVLEPTGGRFHTDSQKDAWVVVELPKMAYINGVVTIATSNLWRLKDMKVQYSETGKDDDWQDAGAMPHPTDWQVNRLDLQESKPRARFIRILRPGGPEIFQLNGIFVYGKPAA